MNVQPRFCQPREWKSAKIFCKQCIANQNLLLEILQSKDVESNELLLDLQSRYPLACSQCQPKVDMHIKEQNSKLPLYLSLTSSPSKGVGDGIEHHAVVCTSTTTRMQHAHRIFCFYLMVLTLLSTFLVWIHFASLFYKPIRDQLDHLVPISLFQSSHYSLLVLGFYAFSSPIFLCFGNQKHRDHQNRIVVACHANNILNSFWQRFKKPTISVFIRLLLLSGWEASRKQSILLSILILFFATLDIYRLWRSFAKCISFSITSKASALPNSDPIKGIEQTFKSLSTLDESPKKPIDEINSDWDMDMEDQEGVDRSQTWTFGPRRFQTPSEKENEGLADILNASLSF